MVPLARWLAGNAILAWGSPIPVDALVAVPRAWTRRLRHGRPLAELLAEELGHRLRRPVLQPLRRRPGPPQTSLSADARRRAPHGAFTVAARVRGVLRGAHLLLVDDVLTTGATLDACARALEGAGARSVVAAVIARAGGSSPSVR